MPAETLEVLEARRQGAAAVELIAAHGHAIASGWRGDRFPPARVAVEGECLQHGGLIARHCSIRHSGHAEITRDGNLD